MPVPNDLDKLYDYLDDLMGRRIPEGKHALFEMDYLVTTTFRHYSSNRAAVRNRIAPLLEDGRLAKVSVSESGYVHLREEGAPLLYFQYFNQRTYDPDDWGFVTFERTADHDNVWRSGSRYLFTTGERLEALTAEALQFQEEKRKAEREEKSKENAKVHQLLNQITADATVLLERLDAAGPDLDAHTWVSGLRGDQVYMGLTLRTPEQFTAFFDILRRGLPDVPRETSGPS